MKSKLLLLVFLVFFSCKKEWNKEIPNDDIRAVIVKDVEFKVLDSHYINNDALWKPFEKYWESFTEQEYLELKPYIIEQDIPTLQERIYAGKLSYEKLTLFYLYRIKKHDRMNELSLNSVIALNSDVVEQAKEKDHQLKNRMRKHPIFGMPILLKDNINTSGMPTTAGAIAMTDNTASDAFIVTQLKQNGALILGKTNLSEWAYFFCGECPSGYSAVGGQTLNPYGRKVFDTGGSSSGSGVASSMNFAVATVGSETAGSILSPAAANSVVGLKPTIGMLSRTGIVPISSTLDTPGPITKNVIDTGIMMSAMFGNDTDDSASLKTDFDAYWFTNYFVNEEMPFESKSFGVYKDFLKDTLYANAVEILKKKGAKIFELESKESELNGFLTLLNIDMRNDLPKYLKNNASKKLSISSVQDVIDFNKKDSILTMPYGQALFYGIVGDTTNTEGFERVKSSLAIKGKQYFEDDFYNHSLDAILSINNYHAAEAAVAKYPALTVPMGYTIEGQPKGLTFIAKPMQDNELIELAANYETASKERKVPEGY
ncbi:MAG: amidase [Urechidicola sp.]|jgi:amidase